MDKVVGKIIVLREICENKSILFGPFSADITLQRKVDLWNQILNKAKSLGLVSYDKDYKYMRDVYWQNMKRTALGKSKTKKEKKYSPIDDLVFEILEKPTAPVPPLPKVTEETFITKQEDEDFLDSHEINSTKQEEDINHNPNIVYLEAAETTSPVSKKRIRPNKTKFLNEEKIRKKKMALQVEFMELQNYKLKLEALEMEKKLGVNPSKYTKEILRKMRREKSNDNNDYNDNEDSEAACDSDDA